MFWKFLLVIDFEFLGVDQNSIPYTGEVILAIFFIKGELVDPDVDGFLNDPGEVMPLLPIMLKFFIVVRWPLVVWWPCFGKGSLRCSFISPHMFYLNKIDPLTAVLKCIYDSSSYLSLLI